MSEYVNDIGVYRERAYLIAFLATLYPHMFLAGTEEFDGWPCIYITLPTGQVSWHIAPDDLDLFRPVYAHDPVVWDGHSVEEKYRRLHQQTLRNRA